MALTPPFFIHVVICCFSFANLNKMTKEEILKNIADCFDKEKSNKARNSMGVSESNYNPYYLTGKCFTVEELSEMSETELNDLIKLADYASDAFY